MFVTNLACWSVSNAPAKQVGQALENIIDWLDEELDVNGSAYLTVTATIPA